MVSSDEPVILPSAHKHGVKDDDILHAWARAIASFNQGDGMVMYIGPNQAGTLIEVGVIDWYGTDAIAHAMTPAREKYLRFL